MRQGAIFDMDGLLTDTERCYVASWKETAAHFGQDWVPGFEKAVAGTSGETMRAAIHAHFPAVDARAFQDWCVARAYELGWEELRPMPGAEAIVRYLRGRDVKTAVASSSPLEVIHRYLSRLGWEDLFDSVTSGHEVSRGKPFPDVFLLAAERIGVPPERCWVFEDGVSGSRAGIAAGCATVMIPDLFEPTEDLRAGCAGIWHSLSDAQAAIEAGELV